MEFTPRMTQNMRTAQAAAVGSMVLLKNIHDTPASPAPGLGEAAGSRVWHGPGADGLRLPGVCALPQRQCAGRSLRLGAGKADGLLAHKYRGLGPEAIPPAICPGGACPWRSWAGNNAAAVVVLSRDEDAYDPIINNDELAMLEAVTKGLPPDGAGAQYAGLHGGRGGSFSLRRGGLHGHPRPGGRRGPGRAAHRPVGIPGPFEPELAPAAGRVYPGQSGPGYLLRLPLF